MKHRSMVIPALLVAFLLTSCTTQSESPTVTPTHSPSMLDSTGDRPTPDPDPKQPSSSKNRPYLTKEWPEPSISSVALTDEAYAALSHAVVAVKDVLTQDGAIPECTMRAGGVLLKKKYEGPYIVPDQLNVVAEYFSTISSGKGPKDGKRECYNGATVFLTDAQWTGKTNEFIPYPQ